VVEVHRGKKTKTGSKRIRLMSNLHHDTCFHGIKIDSETDWVFVGVPALAGLHFTPKTG
jgi:hypothetical protein